jgi:hypothetical protein
VHGFSAQSVTFFAAVFLVAFCASITRSVRDSDFRSSWNLLGLGGSAGFLCVGVVAVLARRGDGADGDNWYWLGLAALLGLLGKEQDKVLRIIVGGVIRGFRQAIDEAEQKEKDPQ